METASRGPFAELVNSLIKMKAKRDNGFTSGRLSSEIGVNRSILKRILSGEVPNPRLDTIQKICQYFYNDGFPVNIEEIVTNADKKTISKVGIPLFMSGSCISSVGSIEMDSITKGSADMLAILAENDVSPMSKKGSVFIVNTSIKAKAGQVVAVKDVATNTVSFFNAANDGASKVNSINKDEDLIKLTDTQEVLGVVVKINAEL